MDNLMKALKTVLPVIVHSSAPVIGLSIIKRGNDKNSMLYLTRYSLKLKHMSHRVYSVETTKDMSKLAHVTHNCIAAVSVGNLKLINEGGI